MGTIVYGLCAVMSVLCAIVLHRGFRRSGMRLLLWSSLCFSIFALSNIMLFVDLVLLGPQFDLTAIRNTLSLAAAAIMLFGLIWETV